MLSRIILPFGEIVRDTKVEERNNGVLKSLVTVVKSNIGGSASLEEAAREAPKSTGVYKLYLNGNLMKVGKAEWREGIRWRMQQYWRGDSTAGNNHGRSIYENRDRITAQWIVCPKEKCRELEVKLQNQAGGIDNLPWCDRT